MADELKPQIIVGLGLDTSDVGQGIDDVKKKLGSLGDVDVNKSVKTLKNDLREAKAEAERMFKEFGAGSEEFRKASTKVAGLKNDIDEVNLSIQNFNPDNKLQALVSLGRAGVGALQGVAGAMAVIGVESDSAQKTIAKLQGLMAMGDALNSLGDLKDTWKNLNSLISSSTILKKADAAATTVASGAMRLFGASTVATGTAFKALKVAIASTGIGLLVVAIGALLPMISDWISGTGDAEAAQKRLNSALEAQRELLDDDMKMIDQAQRRAVARAKIAGKSEAEIKQIEQGYGNERIQRLKEEYEAKEKLAADSNGRSVEEQDKVLKESNDAFKKYLDAQFELGTKDIEDQASLAEKSRQQAKADADKAEQLRKQAADKAKQERDKELGELKSHQDEVNKINQESLDNIAKRGKTEKEVDLLLLSKDYAQKSKLIQDTEAEELKVFKKYNSEKTLGKEKYQAGLNAIQVKYQGISTNLLTDYLAEQVTIEQKYQKVISDYIDGALQETADKYTQKRTEINQQIDELLKNATESQKTELEKLRSSQLGKVDQEQNLETTTIKAETNLVNTEINNTIDDSDTPEERVTKLQAVYDAEKTWKEAKLAEELARLEGDEVAKANVLAKYKQDELASEEDLANQKKAIDDSVKEAKLSNMQAVSGAAGALSDLIGQTTVAGKALGVAQATIDTYVGANKALAQGGIAGIAMAAVVIAQGIMNVKKILSTKVPAKNAGGAGGSAPSVAGTAPVIQAAQTAAATAAVQDVRVVNQKEQVVKAYVTDRDLKDNEQKSNFINSMRSF